MGDRTIRITKKLVRNQRDQPNAKLGFGATPLTAFFQSLGEAMFGERWVDAPVPAATEPNRVGVEGPISRTMQVVEQMRLGLQSEEITAAVHLRLPPRQPSESDEVAFDDGEDADRHYPIAAWAWDGDWPASVTDWTTSEMRVHIRHVHGAEGMHHGRHRIGRTEGERAGGLVE